MMSPHLVTLFLLLRPPGLMTSPLVTRQAPDIGRGPQEIGDYLFPEPELENVYAAWKPLDRGHPLVDVTIHYAPPELERVHIGSGPVPARPQTGRTTKHHLVFEASRAVSGDTAARQRHTDTRLQAEVYNSPRFDKGLSLNSRDTIVAIPSQRRNSFAPFHSPGPQHTRDRQTELRGKPGHRRHRPRKLQSGIYYVDDPHATFRDESERRAQNRVSEDNNYHYDESPASAPAPGPPRLRFVPVSQISTPPTITTTSKPYGEIVNRDFYETVKEDSLRSRAKQSRRVPDYQAAPVTARTERTWPLGSPGYLQEPVSSGQGWAPSPPQPSVYYDRDMEYIRDQAIYGVKDSGELVPPTAQAPIPYQEPVNSDDTDMYPAAEYNLVYAIDQRSNLNVTGAGEPGAHSGHKPDSEMMTSGLSSELLYLLCMREVPRYLQQRLCQSQPGPGPQRRSQHSRDQPQPLARLPPKPQFKFVQDNQYVSSTPAVFQERTLAGVGEEDDDLLDDGNGHLPDDLQSAPFPFVTSASSGPAPVIYSVQQSKVRVYKPESTTTTTVRPSTTTEATTTTTSSTTVRPYEYQLPPSTEQPQRPPAQPQQRPLVFSKRRPAPGEARVSKPFEYLSRLSSFLSDRVFTGPGRRQRTESQSQRRPLVRLRTQGS